MTIVFQITNRLYPFDDTVTVKVGSGNPNGSEEEFAEHVRQSLVEWYDDNTTVRVQQIINAA